MNISESARNSIFILGLNIITREQMKCADIKVSGA